MLPSHFYTENYFQAMNFEYFNKKRRKKLQKFVCVFLSAISTIQTFFDSWTKLAHSLWSPLWHTNIYEPKKLGNIGEILGNIKITGKKEIKYAFFDSK